MEPVPVTWLTRTGSVAGMTLLCLGMSGPELLFPVPAVPPSAMATSFFDRRGDQIHHAVDIMAPRHSEVVAVAVGTIARMMNNAAGGIVIYQFSSGQRFCDYCAHLQGYAEDLAEGQTVRRGQVLGYVGSSGNASEDAPHLHFTSRGSRGRTSGGAARP